MVAKVPAVLNKQAGTSAGGASASENVKKQQRFKGVRMRAWGKWVSEIRLPNTRARLWLGSYASAEQAARAFDVAVVCLRGRSASLNFPDSPPDYAPLDLPHHQIVELAAAAASAVTDPSSPSSSSSQYSAQSVAAPPSESFGGSFEPATSRHRLDSPATTSSLEEELSETGTDAESSNCASSTMASMQWEQLLSLDEDAIDQCTESNVFTGLQLDKFGLPGSELGACVWPEDLLMMDWGGHSLAAAQPEHSALLSIDDENWPSQIVDPEPSLLLWSF